jgi:drug/metabolite transporter (DMT)-like permease
MSKNDDNRPNRQTQGILHLQGTACLAPIFLCILFGASPVAVKLTLTGLGPFTSAGVRFSMALPVIWLWAIFTGQSFRIPRKHILDIIFISLIFTTQMSCYYKGISSSTASRSILIVNFQPFLVLFLAHFFIPGERITLKNFLGITLGFSGICFLFLKKNALVSDFHHGDLITLLSALCWAANIIYTKLVLKNLQPFHTVLYPMAISIPFFFLAGFLWDDFMITKTGPKVLGALLYQVLIVTAFGFVTWNALLKKYGPGALNTFFFILPVAGVFFGGLILNEPITLKMLIALLFIVSGIIVVQFRTGNKVR